MRLVLIPCERPRSGGGLGTFSWSWTAGSRGGVRLVLLVLTSGVVSGFGAGQAQGRMAGVFSCLPCVAQCDSSGMPGLFWGFVWLLREACPACRLRGVTWLAIVSASSLGFCGLLRLAWVCVLVGDPWLACLCRMEPPSGS